MDQFSASAGYKGGPNSTSSKHRFTQSTVGCILGEANFARIFFTMRSARGPIRRRRRASSRWNRRPSFASAAHRAVICGSNGAGRRPRERSIASSIISSIFRACAADMKSLRAVAWLAWMRAILRVVVADDKLPVPTGLSTDAFDPRFEVRPRVQIREADGNERLAH